MISVTPENKANRTPVTDWSGPRKETAHPSDTHFESNLKPGASLQSCIPDTSGRFGTVHVFVSLRADEESLANTGPLL